MNCATRQRLQLALCSTPPARARILASFAIFEAIGLNERTKIAPITNLKEAKK